MMASDSLAGPVPSLGEAELSGLSSFMTFVCRGEMHWSNRTKLYPFFLAYWINFSVAEMEKSSKSLCK